MPCLFIPPWGEAGGVKLDIAIFGTIRDWHKIWRRKSVHEESGGRRRGRARSLSAFRVGNKREQLFGRRSETEPVQLYAAGPWRQIVARATAQPRLISAISICHRNDTLWLLPSFSFCLPEFLAHSYFLGQRKHCWAAASAELAGRSLATLRSGFGLNYFHNWRIFCNRGIEVLTHAVGLFSFRHC